jgi:hypothetical protein
MPAWLAPALIAAATTVGGHLLNKYDQSGGPGSGTPEQFKKLKTSTRAQDKFARGLYESGGGLNQNPLYQQGQDYLSRILGNNQQAYEDFEAPYMQNFNERIAPGIAERFAGMGTGAGALNSSAFQQTLAHAGRGLQSDLAQMRAGLQQNAANQSLQYAQQPISNLLQGLNFHKYENAYMPRQPGMTDSLAKILPSILQASFQNYGNQQDGQQQQPFQGGGIGAQGNMNYQLYR